MQVMKQSFGNNRASSAISHPVHTAPTLQGLYALVTTPVGLYKKVSLLGPQSTAS